MVISNKSSRLQYEELGRRQETVLEDQLEGYCSNWGKRAWKPLVVTRRPGLRLSEEIVNSVLIKWVWVEILGRQLLVLAWSSEQSWLLSELWDRCTDDNQSHGQRWDEIAKRDGVWSEKRRPMSEPWEAPAFHGQCWRRAGEWEKKNQESVVTWKLKRVSKGKEWATRLLEFSKLKT